MSSTAGYPDQTKQPRPRLAYYMKGNQPIICGDKDGTLWDPFSSLMIMWGWWSYSQTCCADRLLNIWYEDQTDDAMRLWVHSLI